MGIDWYASHADKQNVFNTKETYHSSVRRDVQGTYLYSHQKMFLTRLYDHDAECQLTRHKNSSKGQL